MPRNHVRSVLLAFVLLLFASVFPISQALASGPDHSGTYQIDVVPLNTPWGSPALNTSDITKTVAAVSNIYSTLSGGAVKMVFRNLYQSESFSSQFTSMSDIYKSLLNNYPPADEGFAGRIVIIAWKPNSSIPFSGQQFQSNEYNFIGLNENFNINATIDLSHEIGHYFGLSHSSAGLCNADGSPITCTAKEYGDNSDIMGQYILGYSLQLSSGLGRFSATQLDNLGLIPSEEIFRAETSTTTSILPVYSSSKSGLKLIYIPIDNQDGYSIEYRAASDLESSLALTKFPGAACNCYYDNVPSFGVQIRLLSGITQLYKNSMPVIKYDDGASGLFDPSAGYSVDEFSAHKTLLMVNPKNSQQGFNAGDSINLFDGTIVKVISADPVAGARVEIKRPGTSSGPSFDGGPYSLISNSYKNGDGSYTVNRDSKGKLLWPVFTIKGPIPSDPASLTSIQLSDGPTTIDSYDRSKIYSTSFTPAKPLESSFTPATLGIHDVQITAVDSNGFSANQSIAKVNLVPYVIPGIDPRNFKLLSVTWNSAVVLAAECNVTEGENVSLSLNGLTEGKIVTAPGSDCNWTTFTLTGLQPLTTYQLSLHQEDQWGQVGVDSPVVITTGKAPVQVKPTPTPISKTTVIKKPAATSKAKPKVSPTPSAKKP